MRPENLGKLLLIKMMFEEGAFEKGDKKSEINCCTYWEFLFVIWAYVGNIFMQQYTGHCEKLVYAVRDCTV